MLNPARVADRLGFIDALRGVAALIVVLSHALTVSWDWLPHHDPLRLLGEACMVVFFVISGFFLPITCEQVGSVGRFWIRRFFRLFPIYWASIAVALAIVSAGIWLPTSPPQRPSIGVWLFNLTMLQDFFHKPSVLGVFWTLKIELVIYATFSALFALNLHKRSVLMVAVMLGTFLAFKLFQVAVGSAFAVANPRFFYFAPLMGLLAYRYIHGQLRRWPMILLAAGQAALLLASLSIDHALGRARPRDDHFIVVHAVAWPIGYGAFFLALAYRRHLSVALLGWLGRMSYSVYLLHVPVLALLLKVDPPGWIFYAMLFTVTLVVSDISYRLIEARCISVGLALEKRLLGSKSTAFPESTSTALPRDPAPNSLAA